MKNMRLAHGVLIALSLAASAASAQDYPAANFQPKVIYSSEQAVNTATSAPCPPKVEQSEVDAKYPAASFQPKIIYSNADAKQGS